MGKQVHRYIWEGEYASEGKAMDVAESFHEALKGRDDYVESRILLNVDGNHVTLVEFLDSETHVHVERDGNGRPVLEIYEEG